MFDANMYTQYPRSLPTIATAAFICSIFILIYYFGLFFSSGIIILLGFGLYYISQPTIVFKTSRIPNGFAWGTILSIGGAYYSSIAKYYSPMSICISTCVLLTIIVTLHLSKVTVPDHLVANPDNAIEK